MKNNENLSNFAPGMREEIDVSLTKRAQECEEVETALVISKQYRFRVSNYLAEAMQNDGTGALRRQYLTSVDELNDGFGIPDPLGEEEDSPVTGLIHRYQNRVALYVTNACVAFCRFCLRKRKIGQKDFVISEQQLDQCVAYIGRHNEIREVIITGGDPLSLANEILAPIIGLLRQIPHIEILRVCTRFPVQAPARIDQQLCKLLRSSQPLYIMVHVNHPAELSPDACRAIKALGASGVPLLSQTVLLKGVNDSGATLRELFEGLLKVGVKPYHLYQANRVRGASHFIVPIERAVRIVSELWGHTSGLAVPIFVYNAEEGKGKIPLLPYGFMVSESGQEILFTNYKGEIATYYKEGELSRSSVVGQEEVPVSIEKVAD